MSKGMKQKITIVSAFMHQPEILLLDEPTSGLDPLMQEKFVNLVLNEKSKGNTILLSSHIFDEVSKVCDRIGTLKKGRLVNEISIDEIKFNHFKTFEVKFCNPNDENNFANNSVFKDKCKKTNDNTLCVDLDDSEINAFIKELSLFEIAFLTEHKRSLEEHFMKYYGDDND